jgi:hypothetical protein
VFLVASRNLFAGNAFHFVRARENLPRAYKIDIFVRLHRELTLQNSMRGETRPCKIEPI